MLWSMNFAPRSSASSTSSNTRQLLCLATPAHPHLRAWTRGQEAHHGSELVHRLWNRTSVASPCLSLLSFFSIYPVVGSVHAPGNLFCLSLFFYIGCGVSQQDTRLTLARVFLRSSFRSLKSSPLSLAMFEDNGKEKGRGQWQRQRQEQQEGKGECDVVHGFCKTDLWMCTCCGKARLKGKPCLDGK
jgi:hypothetical protein